MIGFINRFQRYYYSPVSGTYKCIEANGYYLQKSAMEFADGLKAESLPTIT
jgi:hypothetical protein